MANLLDMLMQRAQQKPNQGVVGSTMSAIPQDTLLGGLSSGLGAVRDFGNKVNVPYLGGMGDMFIGKTPEEVENWSYGNSPFQSTEMGLPQIKQERKQSLFDALSSLMPGARMTEGLPVGMAIKKVRMGDIGFDPRFDDRVLEQNRLNNLTTVKDTPDFVPETVSLADHVDESFITAMSDRSGLAKLLSINDVPMDMYHQGGQPYMFHNPGQTWSSNLGPASQIMQFAKKAKEATGEDPLWLPWRMSPSGGDFANQTGETMLRFAHENMGKRDQNAANKMIKKIIPNWQGMGTEEGITQFRTSPKYMRDSVMNQMDVQFRNRGGLGIGETRLAVADPSQLNGKDGGLMNVGQIFGDQKLIPDSGHHAYKYGIPGKGLGTLDREIMVHQLLPDFVKERGVNALNPKRDHIRALEVNAYAGKITEELLRKLGY